jgi:hypothetical protein
MFDELTPRTMHGPSGGVSGGKGGGKGGKGSSGSKGGGKSGSGSRGGGITHGAGLGLGGFGFGSSTGSSIGKLSTEKAKAAGKKQKAITDELGPIALPGVRGSDGAGGLADFAALLAQAGSLQTPLALIQQQNLARRRGGGSNVAKGGFTDGVVLGAESDKAFIKAMRQKSLGLNANSIEGRRAIGAQKANTRNAARKAGGSRGGSSGIGGNIQAFNGPGESRQSIRRRELKRRGEDSAFGLDELKKRMTIEAMFKKEEEDRKREMVMQLLRQFGGGGGVDHFTDQTAVNVGGNPQALTLRGTKPKDNSSLIAALSRLF